MNYPNKASVVIIGGGIIGCSVAYHLGKRGVSDVVLLERRKLSCGTTWHSVGSVGELRGTPLATELARYTVTLLRGLEAETGQSTGLKQPGSIMLALNKDRLTEMKRTISMAKAVGLQADLIDRSEIARRCPYVRIDDVLAGMWIPTDGRVNAGDTTTAYAKGARQGGVQIFEDTPVETLIVEAGKVAGVITAQGPIRCDAVALCTGLWSRAFAARYGVSLPLHAAEHFYAVTEPIAGFGPGLPLIRVPDESTYYKDDAGKLLFGCLERRAKPWGMNGIPDGFCFDSLPADLEHFEPILTKAMDRFPLLRETGIRLFFNGPETFTADGNALIGEVPELQNLFVACGMNTVGVISSGSVGRILADWIHDRQAPVGVVDVDVRRSMPFQSGDRFLFDRTVEALGILYDMAWPTREYASARGARRSPLHDQLVASGAVMGEHVGWELPLVFAPPGSKAEIEYSFGRQNWADWCADECEAASSAVALFDSSRQAKILIEGRDAAALLQRVCATSIALSVGSVCSTLWLNARGRIISMPTLLRLGDERYLLLTSPASQRRDAHWLRRQLGASIASITDVTPAWTLLNLRGPKAGNLLSATTDTGAAGIAGSAIGYAPIVSWQEQALGLPGWAVLLSTEFATHAFERLREAGRAFGLRCAGAYAADSLRVEAGEPTWGADVDDSTTPAELGLTLAPDRDFIGRSSTATLGVDRRLVRLSLQTGDRGIQTFRQEPIFADDRPVGITTSGAFGYRRNRPVSIGWINGTMIPAFGRTGTVKWEIEIAGERLPAEAEMPFE